MDEIGVSTINIGFPGFSEEDKKNIRRISNENFKQASITASAHIIRSDIDACLGCGIREISVFTPFNELNLQYMLKMGKEEVLEKPLTASNTPKNMA